MPATRKPASAASLPVVLKNFYEKHQSLPDGIYLNLPDNVYHADTALGSSNIRDLLKGANLFWFKSALNPKRKPEKKTPSKILGSATHKLLLEGRVEYDKFYVRGPYDDDDDLSPSQKSALTKDAKKSLLEHQELLTSADYDFVLGCKAILDQDPNLKGCLDNALTEVSVFWTRTDGVRVKARFDALKLRGIGDIKTIANERERDLPQACRLDISTYSYDIPAAHYCEGRRQLGRLVGAGQIYNWAGDGKEGPVMPSFFRRIVDGDAVAFLKNCASMTNFGFQFVFIPKKGAPDAWSCTLSLGNPLIEEARTDIEIGIERFKYAMEQFGLEQRWVPLRDVEELYQEHLPQTHGRDRRRIG